MHSFPNIINFRQLEVVILKWEDDKENLVMLETLGIASFEDLSQYPGKIAYLCQAFAFFM